MAFPGTGRIWMNGKLVEWKDATIHVASHVIHYGSAVFEGARCYATPRASPEKPRNSIGIAAWHGSNAPAAAADKAGGMVQNSRVTTGGVRCPRASIMWRSRAIITR